MAAFLGRDFLLTTDVAKDLYHDYAKSMPIVDYHCHINPKEIYEDRHFANLTQAWLEGDHYKWRLLRANGVDEFYITGGASDREKFQKFAEMMPKAIGNPMYHWCHLELKNFFGYEGVLNGETAQAVWELTEKKLQEPGMGVRGLIAQSNVAFIGTTDDPADTLEWHKKIAADETIAVKVAPSYRPDKAINIDKAGWKDYIAKLSAAAGMEIDSAAALKKVLAARMDLFAECGCRASDHGLDYMVYAPASDEAVEAIFRRGMNGEPVSACEAEPYKTALLRFCAKEYARRGWVMQLHYNCMRNPNSAMFAKLGPDTGYDCIGPHSGAKALAGLLDSLFAEDALPKTIVYSLDGSDNAMIDSLIGAFQGPEAVGKLQHGSAWWFNDHKQGMRDQLISLANLGLLGNFVGMLTDSRSFLSYARHEYFRRILCGLIGEWVEDGEYPDDRAALKEIVEGVCYNNAKRYFDL